MKFAGKRIMVVEDDHMFRDVLVTFLSDNGFHVREAENGLAGQTIFDVTEFDIILTDIKMPEMDGISLLKHIVRSNKNIPVVVMTGFSELIETKTAYEYGAKEFLSKPFAIDDLLSVLDGILFPTKENKDSADQKYCCIGIADFVYGSTLTTDIYIRLGGTKYVKIGNKGQAVDKERVKQYIAKGVEEFYIQSNEFAKYIGFNIKLTDAVKSKLENASKEKFQKLVKHTSESILQEIFVEGLDKQKVNFAKNWIQNSMISIAEYSNLADLLSALGERDDDVFEHSVSVSLYSCMLARELGIQSNLSIYKLCLAAFLHDIGKKEIPVELSKTPRYKLSLEETQLLDSHTRRGRDILAQIPNLPDDVAEVAHSHHELWNGTGYPDNLKGNKINALARIVSIANAFVHDMHLSITNANGKKNSEILKQTALKILQVKSNDFDPSCVVALLKLCECEIPEELKEFEKKFVS